MRKPKTKSNRINESFSADDAKLLNNDVKKKRSNSTREEVKDKLETHAVVEP